MAEHAVGLIKDKLKKMDVSPSNVPLYIGLNYILRSHGLTPHTSTGKCPYEMIKHGPVPSLLPSLTLSERQRSRCEKVQAAYSKERRRCRQFRVGEDVFFYEDRVKSTENGRILKVLGKNTYLGEINGVQKHISGDNL